MDFARCSIPESKHCKDEEDGDWVAMASASSSSSSSQCLDSGMLQRAKSILMRRKIAALKLYSCKALKCWKRGLNANWPLNLGIASQGTNLEFDLTQ